MLDEFKKLQPPAKALVIGGGVLILGLLYLARSSGSTAKAAATDARTALAQIQVLAAKIDGVSGGALAGQNAAAQVAANKAAVDAQLNALQEAAQGDVAEMKTHLDRLEGQIATLSSKLRELNAAQETLRSQVGNASQSTTTKPDAPAANPGLVQEAEGFRVELISIRATNEGVIANFRVTNLGQDGEFQFDDYGTSLFDDRGNELKPRGSVIGSNGKPEWGGGSSGHYAKTISGVTTDASILFEKASPDARMAAALDVHAGRGDGVKPKLSFRKIPISR